MLLPVPWRLKHLISFISTFSALPCLSQWLWGTEKACLQPETMNILMLPSRGSRQPACLEKKNRRSRRDTSTFPAPWQHRYFCFSGGFPGWEGIIAFCCKSGVANHGRTRLPLPPPTPRIKRMSNLLDIQAHVRKSGAERLLRWQGMIPPAVFHR